MPCRHQSACCAADAQDHPARGKASGKCHADKHEQINQAAARIARDQIIEHEHKKHMRCGLDDVGKTLKIALLPQLDHLVGQQKDERDLHDLRRLHRDGKIPDAEPGTVVVSRKSQRREQQQDKADVESEEPFPALAQLRHVQRGEEKECHNADHPAQALHDHAFERPVIHRVRGTGDQHHTVERGQRAQRQQHQIRLAQHVVRQLP